LADTVISKSERARRRQKEKPARTPAPKKDKSEKQGETTMEFIASIAAVFVIGLFIITFIVQAFEIPSKSMVNTLLVGDHVFVDRERLAPPTSWARWLVPYRNIRRGDIVVFLSPAEAGLFVVKRIRGVPGDHLHLRDGRLYVNGELQDEPFVVRNGSYSPYRDNFPSIAPTDFDQVTPEWHLTLSSYLDKNGDLVVPPDSYFAMGDNRDISYDSRYWGFVPRENVIGRPLFIYWSFETPEDQYQKKAISDRLSFIGHVILHFFDETRWSRTLRMVR
jgi:signal peptidase I